MSALMGSRGTSQAGPPTWWASLVVRSASLPLPAEHRWRYRQEFLAELYGMPPAEQLHHVTGVLSASGPCGSPWRKGPAPEPRCHPRQAPALPTADPPLAAAAQPRRRLIPPMPGLWRATGRYRWGRAPAFCESVSFVT